MLATSPGLPVIVAACGDRRQVADHKVARAAGGRFPC